MPGGALVGTVVHSVLERTDFDAPDLAAAVATALDRELAWRNVDLGDTRGGRRRPVRRHRVAARARWSAACACATSPARDRLDELGFELPLVGGDTPTATLRRGATSPTCSRRTCRRATRWPRYATRLRDPALGGVLRGYLTGSLDLVLRLPGDRFVLADYKTNWLGAPDETLTAWHYRPEALEAEMEAAHYPLQALLYTVALHRYLRWRFPGYDPARTSAACSTCSSAA